MCSLRRASWVQKPNVPGAQGKGGSGLPQGREGTLEPSGQGPRRCWHQDPGPRLPRRLARGRAVAKS